MIASLPMYLRDETRAANEAFWALTRDALRDHGQMAPDALDHDAPIHATWGRDDLTLGQICNLPYRAHFDGALTLIGAADYGLSDAEPGHYYSVFVVRADDPRGAPAAFANARFALNEPGSHSGWGAPWMYARANGFAFSDAIQSGGHRRSAMAVAEGHADMAALDAVSWALIQRYDPFASKLRVIARTGASPGLTFITAKSNAAAPFQTALSQAIEALSAEHAETLLLRAVVQLPETAYTDLPIPDAPPIQCTTAKSA